MVIVSRNFKPPSIDNSPSIRLYKTTKQRCMIFLYATLSYVTPG